MTTTSSSVEYSGDGAAPPSHPRAKWLILAVLGIAQLMVVLDATIVNIALPAAQLDLGFDNADRSWVVTAYALAFGSLLLLGGRLSDLVGRRTTFLVGLIGFAVMSAVGGAAQSFGMLVAARAGQGVFGALLAPAALSLLAVTFTDTRERAKAFGIFGAIAGGGGAVGLLLGGVLTEWANWRWALFVNLAFAAVAFIGGFLLLSKNTVTERPVLDVPGTLTGSTGLLAIVYGFAHAESDGWSDSITVASLVTGAVLLAVFVVLQNRVAHPLLPMRVILDPTRAGSYLAMFATGAGMFAVFLFLTYYLQNTLRLSPIVTGFAFMPMIGTLIVTASLSTSVLLPRFGPRIPMASGLAIAALGMAMMTAITATSSYTTHVLPGLLVLGVGLGATFAPAMQGAISGVAAHDAGVASATVNTMQQVGGSIGTALLSTMAASAGEHYAASRLTGVTDLAGAAALRADAEVAAYITTFWWAAGIFALGAVIVAAVVRPGKLADIPDGVVVVGH